MAGDLQVWEYRGLKVFYRPELNGEGTMQAHDFVHYLRDLRPKPGGYERAFEWCSGPGFIGFALLAEGLVRNLCLADISAPAMECVARTVAENHLEGRVRYWVSDNLKGVPDEERFDLVVGNPPVFHWMNPLHPFWGLAGDLRASDVGWKIHEGFLTRIAHYLEDGALACFNSMDPFTTKVYLAAPGEETYVHPEPADLRPRPPIVDFQRMMRDGGLRFVEVRRVGPTRPEGDGYRKSMLLPIWLVVCRREEPAWQDERPFVVGKLLSQIAATKDGPLRVYHFMPGPPERINARLTLDDGGGDVLRVIERLTVPDQPMSVRELVTALSLDEQDLQVLLDSLYKKGVIDYR
jgi:hypothetical protein